MPKPEKKRRQDESIPGGATIRGGYADPDDGLHYGGVIQDSEGRVLDTFEEDEVNTGVPRPKKREDGGMTVEEARRVVEESRKDRDEALKQLADLAEQKAALERERDELAEKLRNPQAEVDTDADRARKEEAAMREIAGGDKGETDNASKSKKK